LFVDDSSFGPVSLSADANRQLLDQPTSAGLEEYYLMMNCIGLQWLNINNATWCLEENPQEKFPLRQEMVIKMVRNHPTLQWLRSDLSAENVAML